MYKYEDGCSIQLISDDKLIIEFNNKYFEFDETDKPKFYNNLGETVVEYTGLSVDNNQMISWAKASYTPESYSELHYHQKLTEDYYIINGHAKITIEGNEYNLFRGDHILILPGKQHQVVNMSTEEDLTLIVKCVPAWIKDDHKLILRRPTLF